MPVISVLAPVPGRVAGFSVSPGVYQTGSSLENAVFWLVLAIAIIMGFGLILYLFFVRGSYEREKQAALALIGGRQTAAPARTGTYEHSAPAYSYRSDVPDAVAAAMSGMRDRSEEEVELVDETEGSDLPAYLYTARKPAQVPRRGAPLPAPRDYDGRSDRPPRDIRLARPRRAKSPLDDLLHAGDGDNLRDEDRKLLQDEELQPEPELLGISDEDADVTFEDEPEPAPAVHPPAPYRIASREKPAWERVLEGKPASQVGEEPAPEAGESEVDLIDMDEPAPSGPVLSKTVTNLLLQQDIMKTVKGPGSRMAPAAPGRAAAGRAAPSARPGGPAWAEGRPVFSKPLEEPDVPRAREVPPASGFEDTLGEISHKLRSMDQKATPRLPPKAEAKMGLQEKKFLEALRAVQEKKQEEDRSREEDGHRMLEAQMAELERKKKEEEQKRLAEVRRREQQRLERERHQADEMRRWEQARQDTQEKLRSGEDARAEDQRARQDAARRDNERRRKAAQPGPDPSATIDDVLSRIGIKK